MTSTCTANGDPHYRTFANIKHDYYARGLFEHARFPISPCGCTVVIQTLLVKLTAGRYQANSAIGAVAIRVGLITFTITSNGVVHVRQPGSTTEASPDSAEMTTPYGGDGLQLVRTPWGRGWAWKIVFPANAGEFVVCKSARRSRGCCHPPAPWQPAPSLVPKPLSTSAQLGAR